MSTEVTIIPKPADISYRPDRGWRFEPRMAKFRNELAAAYRFMRRDGKAPLARLLYVTRQGIGYRISEMVTRAVLEGHSRAPRQ